ncbi:MAG: 3'-5' exonuclease [Polyangiales bacterium]
MAKAQTPLRHYVVLDFESTCDKQAAPSPQEIIEFPSVLLNAKMEKVAEFESFVRPTHHPVLTPFCMELTGIEQSQVDAAQTFPDIFKVHQAWLGSNSLQVSPEDGVPLDFAFITCGDWDLQTMLPAQLSATDPVIGFVPHAYRRWINIKKPFAAWNGGSVKGGMLGMLKALDLELEGRHHRGIDDCRNIARIASALVERGQKLEVEGELPFSRYPALSLVLDFDGERREVVLKKRAMATLLGLASSTFRRKANKIHIGEERALLKSKSLLDLDTGTVLYVS